MIAKEDQGGGLFGRLEIGEDLQSQIESEEQIKAQQSTGASNNLNATDNSANDKQPDENDTNTTDEGKFG